MIEVAIAALFLFTIIATMAGNIAFQIPPVLIFMTGLSIMFLIARENDETLEPDPILDYI